MLLVLGVLLGVIIVTLIVILLTRVFYPCVSRLDSWQRVYCSPCTPASRLIVKNDYWKPTTALASTVSTYISDFISRTCFSTSLESRCLIARILIYAAMAYHVHTLDMIPYASIQVYLVLGNACQPTDATALRIEVYAFVRAFVTQNCTVDVLRQALRELESRYGCMTRSYTVNESLNRLYTLFAQYQPNETIQYRWFHQILLPLFVSYENAAGAMDDLLLQEAARNWNLDAIHSVNDAAATAIATATISTNYTTRQSPEKEWMTILCDKTQSHVAVFNNVNNIIYLNLLYALRMVFSSAFNDGLTLTNVQQFVESDLCNWIVCPRDWDLIQDFAYRACADLSGSWVPCDERFPNHPPCRIGQEMTCYNPKSATVCRYLPYLNNPSTLNTVKNLCSQGIPTTYRTLIKTITGLSNETMDAACRILTSPREVRNMRIAGQILGCTSSSSSSISSNDNTL